MPAVLADQRRARRSTAATNARPTGLVGVAPPGRRCRSWPGRRRRRPAARTPRAIASAASALTAPCAPDQLGRHAQQLALQVVVVGHHAAAAPPRCCPAPPSAARAAGRPCRLRPRPASAARCQRLQQVLHACQHTQAASRGASRGTKSVTRCAKRPSRDAPQRVRQAGPSRSYASARSMRTRTSSPTGSVLGLDQHQAVDLGRVAVRAAGVPRRAGLGPALDQHLELLADQLPIRRERSRRARRPSVGRGGAAFPRSGTRSGMPNAAVPSSSE